MQTTGVRVTIPYTALLGAGDLAGYGPIPAAVVRDLAAYHSKPPPLTDPEPLTTRPASGPDEPPPF